MRLEKIQPFHHPAQDDLPSLDLPALPGAAAREWRRHRFQRDAPRATGVKSTQLRKDLAWFGTFGTRGLGYDVIELSTKIADELGTSRLQPVILVGVGNLGLALLSYRGFEKEGFEIIAAFDAELRRKRDKEIKQPIYGMDKLREFAQTHGVKMAILTVPAAAAQEVANRLVEAGITGVLNFSPIVISVPEKVMVNNVNLAIELENLSYFTQE